MNTAKKRQLIEVSMFFLSWFSTFLAFYCAIFRFSKINFSIDEIDYCIANSIFLKKDLKKCFNFLNFKDLKHINNLKNNTKEILSNNFVNVNQKEIFLKNNDTTATDEEIHSPNEKKYKIIETQYGKSGLKFDNIYVKNSTNSTIDIENLLKNAQNFKIFNEKLPTVLIYHTHATEAYLNRDENFFYESYYARSLDNNRNVTKVGEAIVEKLKENGIGAIHDVTHHDDPTYRGAYERSAKTVKNILAENPSIKIAIDIHRDSIGSRENGKIKPFFVYNGKKVAQLMLIAGCGDDGTVNHPNWKENLSLSLLLQKYCETLFHGITRPLWLKNVKYNLDIIPGSLLIEIGSDVNTLNEAENTGTMLGEALSALIKDLKVRK